MQQSDHSQSKLKFSLVIPVFNEEENLKVLYTRLTKVMESLGEAYEIIFVDDGSSDSSFQILTDLHQKDGNVKVIRFTRNFGQDIARTAALDYCKGANVILMDGDLQDQPEEIPKLLAKLGEGYDVVYGLRKERQDNLFRKLASKTYFQLVAKMTNQTVDPQITSFRILTRRVVDHMNELREQNRFYGGLISWLGFPSAIVEIEHGRRMAGKSKYGFWKLLKNAAEGVVSFSSLPLQLVGSLGLVMSAVSFVLGIYMLIRQFVWGVAVPGYTSIVVSMFFLGGIVLIVLWVMGQYIGRIHTEVKQRPLYVIRDMIE